MIKELNEQNFKIETSKGLSIIDFWAPWCGPCRMQGPIFKALSQEIEKMNFYKVNIDENPSLTQSYNIMSIPTMIIMKDGYPVETIVGFHQKEQLEQIINQYI